MSFFFLLHPPTVSWLPAPMDMAALDRKRKKALRKLMMEQEQEKRRQRQKQEEDLLLALGLYD